MNVNEKITDNLRQQIRLSVREGKLRDELGRIGGEKQSLAGGMAVLSVLFEEENSVPFKTAIETEPWKKIIDALQQETLPQKD